MNNNGAVVGIGCSYGWFLYSEDVYTELLPAGQGAFFNARDINDTGTVVGEMIRVIDDKASNMKGAIYMGGMYIKLRMPRWRVVLPYAINNSGIVVGTGYYYGINGHLKEGIQKGFIYRHGICIGLLPPDLEWAEAYDVNDSGTVLLGGGNGDTRKVFIYRKGAYTEINPPGFYYVEAYAINNSGALVGYGYSSDNVEGGYKAFIAVPK
jgi:uncharacterized membrane protein